MSKDHPEILFFGDSFIGIFSLLNKTKFPVFKYKGATAKGLTKTNNENRKDIINKIAYYKPKCVVFNFGSVDVFFSFYYKLFVEKKIIHYKTFIDEFVYKYFDFVVSLECDNKCIMLPGYNPIRDNLVESSLINYGIIQEKITDPEMKFVFSRENRNKLVDYFNKTIKKLAKKSFDENDENNRKRNKNLFVIDTNKIVSKNGLIKKEFRDISDGNVHYRWEPLLPLYVKEINKMDFCKIPKNTIKISRETEQEYLRVKKEMLKSRGYM